MDSKSPMSPLPYERYKSRCAWSLIRFCDFRQDDSNMKMISDRKGLKSNVADDSYIKNRPNLHSKRDENCQCVDDRVNKSAAKADKIREEDMASVQHVNKNTTTTGAQHTLSSSRPSDDYSPKNRKRKANKSFHFHGCRNIKTVEYTQPSREKLVNASNKLLNTAASMKASKDSRCRNANIQKHDQFSDNNSQALMNEAAEIFINQKFISGIYQSKEEASHQSKNLLDALSVLNSNQDLFMKLLQDPNSLLVKHIEDLRYSQGKEQRTKYFSEATSSDTIVLLKPSPTAVQSNVGELSDCSSPQSLYSLRNRTQSGNNSKHAYFSFEHMKRKLKNAIGLKRKEKSNDCTLHKSSCNIHGFRVEGQRKGSEAEIPSFNGKSKSTFDVNKSRDNMHKVKDFELDTPRQAAAASGSGHDSSKLSIVRDLRQRETSISVERKESFSEILRNVNEDMLRKQVSKSSGRIFDQSNLFSALSPRRHIEDRFMAGEMRFSPYCDYQMASEKKWSLQKEKRNEYLGYRLIDKATPRAFSKKPTEQLQTSEHHYHNIHMHGIAGSSPRSSRTGPVKVVADYNNINPTGISSQGVSAEPNATSNSDTNQSAGTTTHVHQENRCVDSPKRGPHLDGHRLSSSEDVHSPSSSSIEILEDFNCMKDEAEHSSPVSVLEHIENINKSPSSVDVELSTEPKQINREELFSAGLRTYPAELKTLPSTAMDEHQLMSNHVASLLQTSDINWDELSVKYRSLDQLLDPALCNEFEVLPSPFHGDHRLFFEYINEILLEVCQYYFGSSPWVSFVGPKSRSIQAAKDLPFEVTKQVDRHIISQRPPFTLEQLVEKDLAKPGSWMDIRMHVEEAVYEMVESLLEELTLETAIDLHI